MIYGGAGGVVISFLARGRCKLSNYQPEGAGWEKVEVEGCLNKHHNDCYIDGSYSFPRS